MTLRIVIRFVASLRAKALHITFRFVFSSCIIIDDDRYFEQSVRCDLGKLHETLADKACNTKKTAGVYTSLLCKMSINCDYLLGRAIVRLFALFAPGCHQCTTGAPPNGGGNGKGRREPTWILRVQHLGQD